MKMEFTIKEFLENKLYNENPILKFRITPFRYQELIFLIDYLLENNQNKKLFRQIQSVTNLHELILDHCIISNNNELYQILSNSGFLNSFIECLPGFKDLILTSFSEVKLISQNLNENDKTLLNAIIPYISMNCEDLYDLFDIYSNTKVVNSNNIIIKVKEKNPQLTIPHVCKLKIIFESLDANSDKSSYLIKFLNFTSLYYKSQQNETFGIYYQTLNLYLKDILQILEDIQNKHLINEITVDKLIALIHQNRMFRGELLCITSVTNSKPSYVLINLANCVSSYLAISKGVFKSPIEILLPGINLPSLYDEATFHHLDIIPKDLIAQTALVSYKEFHNGYYISKKTVLEILNQHILNTDKVEKYLIPFIASLDLDINPYSYNSLNDHDVEMLSNAYPHVKEYFKLLNQKNDLLEGNNSLLVQINRLLSSMNSSKVNNGQGTEFNSGFGIYSALVDFFNFYNLIPKEELNTLNPDLLKQVNLIYELSHNIDVNAPLYFDPEDGTHFREITVDTCVNSRFEALSKCVEDDQLALTNICLDVNQAKNLFKDILDDIDQVKIVLKTEFKNVKTKRYYFLPISKEILERYTQHINLEKVHFDKLISIFIKRPIEDIIEILSSEFGNKIIQKIELSPKDFVVSLPEDKIIPVFKLINNYKPLGIFDANSLCTTMHSLHHRKKKLLLTSIKSTLKYCVNSFFDLINLIDACQLFEEQCFIFEAVQNKIIEIFKVNAEYDNNDNEIENLLKYSDNFNKFLIRFWPYLKDVFNSSNLNELRIKDDHGSSTIPLINFLKNKDLYPIFDREFDYFAKLFNDYNSVNFTSLEELSIGDNPWFNIVKYGNGFFFKHFDFLQLFISKDTFCHQVWFDNNFSKFQTAFSILFETREGVEFLKEKIDFFEPFFEKYNALFDGGNQSRSCLDFNFKSTITELGIENLEFLASKIPSFKKRLVKYLKENSSSIVFLESDQLQPFFNFLNPHSHEILGNFHLISNAIKNINKFVDFKQTIEIAIPYLKKSFNLLNLKLLLNAISNFPKEKMILKLFKNEIANTIESSNLDEYDDLLNHYYYDDKRSHYLVRHWNVFKNFFKSPCMIAYVGCNFEDKSPILNLFKIPDIWIVFNKNIRLFKRLVSSSRLNYVSLSDTTMNLNPWTIMLSSTEGVNFFQKNFEFLKVFIDPQVFTMRSCHPNNNHQDTSAFTLLFTNHASQLFLETNFDYFVNLNPEIYKDPSYFWLDIFSVILDKYPLMLILKFEFFDKVITILQKFELGNFNIQFIRALNFFIQNTNPVLSEFLLDHFYFYLKFLTNRAISYRPFIKDRYLDKSIIDFLVDSHKFDDQLIEHSHEIIPLLSIENFKPNCNGKPKNQYENIFTFRTRQAVEFGLFFRMINFSADLRALFVGNFEDFKNFITLSILIDPTCCLKAESRYYNQALIHSILKHDDTNQLFVENFDYFETFISEIPKHVGDSKNEYLAAFFYYLLINPQSNKLLNDNFEVFERLIPDQDFLFTSSHVYANTRFRTLANYIMENFNPKHKFMAYIFKNFLSILDEQNVSIILDDAGQETYDEEISNLLKISLN